MSQQSHYVRLQQTLNNATSIYIFGKREAHM